MRHARRRAMMSRYLPSIKPPSMGRWKAVRALKTRSRRYSSNANETMRGLRNRSEIGPLRRRDADVLIDVATKRVLGADDFRPFAAVAQIDHVRGPRRRESTRVLDREVDLQILVLVV